MAAGVARSRDEVPYSERLSLETNFPTGNVASLTGDEDCLHLCARAGSAHACAWDCAGAAAGEVLDSVVQEAGDWCWEGDVDAWEFIDGAFSSCSGALFFYFKFVHGYGYIGLSSL